MKQKTADTFDFNAAATMIDAVFSDYRNSRNKTVFTPQETVLDQLEKAFGRRDLKEVRRYINIYWGYK